MKLVMQVTPAQGPLLYRVPLMRDEAEGRVLVDQREGRASRPPGGEGPPPGSNLWGRVEWVSPLGFCPSPELGSAREARAGQGDLERVRITHYLSAPTSAQPERRVSRQIMDLKLAVNLHYSMK